MEEVNEIGFHLKYSSSYPMFMPSKSIKRNFMGPGHRTRKLFTRHKDKTHLDGRKRRVYVTSDP